MPNCKCPLEIMLQQLYLACLQICCSKGDVIVTGDAGTGKSSLMMHFCQTWVNAINPNGTSNPTYIDQCHDEMKKYLIIPIVLPLAKENSTWEDILTEQLKLEAMYRDMIWYAIEREKKLEKEKKLKKEKRIIVMIDGWDELGITGDWIQTVTNNSLLKIVVSTRPHGVEAVQRKFKKIYNKVGIRHFTEREMTDYVKKYFIEDPESGKNLLTYLEKQKQLSNMIKIALNLDIICSLWKNRILSDDLKVSEVYKEFVNLWINDFHQECKDVSKITEDLARISFELNRHGKLDVTFSEKNILKCFKELGSGDVKERLLTHATIHNYLGSYFLAQYANEIDLSRFAESFSRSTNMAEYKEILAFLCDLDEKKAIQICQAIANCCENSVESDRYLQFILNVSKEFENTDKKLNLPLPKYVEISQDLDKSRELEQLLQNDLEKSQRKMRHISFATFPKYLSEFDYVTSIEMNICPVCYERGTRSFSNSNKGNPVLPESVVMAFRPCEVCLVLIEAKTYAESRGQDRHDSVLRLVEICKMNISTLCDIANQNYSHSKICEDFFIESHMSLINVKRVELEGEEVVSVIEKIIKRQKQQILEEQKKTETKYKTIQHVEKDQKMPFSDIENIAEFHIETETLPPVNNIPNTDCFLTVRSIKDTDLELFSRKYPSRLKKKIRQLKFTGDPDADGGNLEDQGKALAALLCHCHSLDLLNLENCGIRDDTLKTVYESIKMNMEPVNIRECIITSNVDEENKNYITSGINIGNLLELANIQSLGLFNTGFTGEALSKIHQISYNLRKFHLESNPELAKDFSQMAPLLNRLPNLEILALVNCGLTKESIEKLKTVLQETNRIKHKNCLQRFEKLVVLDFGLNNFSDEGLWEVGHLISLFFPNLYAICTSSCKCEDVNDLLRLIKHLPSSVRHLDVSKNLFGGKIIDMVRSDSKEVNLKLCKLKSLNIGNRDQNEERRFIRTKIENVRSKHAETVKLFEQNDILVSNKYFIENTTKVYFRDQENIADFLEEDSGK